MEPAFHGGGKGSAPSTIHRIWHTFCPQPNQSKTFNLLKDLLFVDNVRDMSGGIRILTKTLWFVVQTKEAGSGTRPLTATAPGQAPWRKHDCKRNGATSLFVALDAATSEVFDN